MRWTGKSPWGFPRPKTVRHRQNNRGHRQLRLESLEDRLAPATFTWTGAGSDALWTNAANWGGTAPSGSATDDLVFPAASVQLTSINNFADGSTFRSIAFPAAPDF